MINSCHFGDAMEGLVLFRDAGLRARCVVTSPPYWGLRDYGHDGQIGLEPTPQDYVARVVEVLDLVAECMADDGTLWLNIGDSYAGSRRGGDTGRSGLQGSTSYQDQSKEARAVTQSRRRDREPIPRSDVAIPGVKQKELVGIPWMLAFSLRSAGWFVRSDIIWAKPNPMPESVRDRPTRSHEHLFLLTRSPRYYYDQDAVSEPLSPSSHARLRQPSLASQRGSARAHGGAKSNGPIKAAGNLQTGKRNRRDVWTIPTRGYKGAHFAVMPEALVEPCILAGTERGDVVMDPFMGSGTVAAVAQRLGRRWFGCEINADYGALQRQRLDQLNLSV